MTKSGLGCEISSESTPFATCPRKADLYSCSTFVCFLCTDGRGSAEDSLHSDARKGPGCADRSDSPSNAKTHGERTPRHPPCLTRGKPSEANPQPPIIRDSGRLNSCNFQWCLNSPSGKVRLPEARFISSPEGFDPDCWLESTSSQGR